MAISDVPQALQTEFDTFVEKNSRYYHVLGDYMQTQPTKAELRPLAKALAIIDSGVPNRGKQLDDLHLTNAQIPVAANYLANIDAQKELLESAGKADSDTTKITALIEQVDNQNQRGIPVLPVDISAANPQPQANAPSPAHAVEPTEAAEGTGVADLLPTRFRVFATNNRAYHEDYKNYKGEFHARGHKEAIDAAIDLTREQKDGWQEKIRNLNLDEDQTQVLTSYTRSKTSEDRFKTSAKDLGLGDATTQVLVDQIDAAGKEDKLVLLDDVKITYAGKDDGKSLAEFFHAQRSAPLPEVEQPSAAPLSLAATAALVKQGAIINVSATSPQHEPAREEIAKVLGLEVDTHGHVASHAQLDKALRTFQTKEGLSSDGTVGPAALEVLQTKIDTSVDALGADMAAKVTGEKGVGYLGGNQNPYDLQYYEDTPNAPRNAEKLMARKAMDDAKQIFNSIYRVVSGQEANNDLTAKEVESLKDLFHAKGSETTPLNPKELNTEGVKAFQKAFHLDADGVIGEETVRALTQINLRLNAGEVIDPSEIKSAVAANVRQKPSQHKG